MKKLLLVLLALFMLVGCKSKPVDDPVVDNSDNTDNQEFDMEFPAEELIGIWNSLDGSDYVRIGGDYDVMVILGNYDTGENTSFVVSDYKCTGYQQFALNCSSSQGLASVVEMDVSAYAHGQIKVFDQYYEYVGMEEGQAMMANRYRKIVSFYNDVKGYFNSEDDKTFVRFGIEDGSYYILYGLYYAGGTPYGFIQDIEDFGDDVYQIAYEYNEGNNFSFDEESFNYVIIDLSGLKNGKATFDGEAYRYLGYIDFDEALNERDNHASENAKG